MDETLAAGAHTVDWTGVDACGTCSALGNVFLQADDALGR